jgi:outer membrane protein assembly factor BamA
VRGYFENDLGTRTSLALNEAGDTTQVSVRRGGEVLLLGSVELRFPLAWIVSGALFLDAGGVWDKMQDLTLRRTLSPLAPGAGYQDMRYSVGGGLRFASPVGPVRVDYGYKLRSTRADEPDLNPRRASFHFSLGQAF